MKQTIAIILLVAVCLAHAKKGITIIHSSFPYFKSKFDSIPEKAFSSKDGMVNILLQGL